MRKLVYLVILITMSLQAKDMVILEDLNSIGLWSGPRVGLTSIDEHRRILVGVSGMVTLNRHFGIGFGGYSLNPHREVNEDVDYRYYSLKYSGLLLQYIPSSQKPIHFSTGVLLGRGSYYYNFYDLDPYFANEEGEKVYIFEPNIGFELNFTQYIRLQLSASYRFPIDVDFESLEIENIESLNLVMYLNFGYEFDRSKKGEVSETDPEF